MHRNFEVRALHKLLIFFQKKKRSLIFFFGCSQTISWDISFALWIDCYWKIQSFEKRKEKEDALNIEKLGFCTIKGRKYSNPSNPGFLWKNGGSSCSLKPSFPECKFYSIEQFLRGGRAVSSIITKRCTSPLNVSIWIKVKYHIVFYRKDIIWPTWLLGAVGLP